MTELEEHIFKDGDSNETLNILDIAGSHEVEK